MIAKEAKYHTQCLVTLYNKASEVASSDEREIDSDLAGCLEDLVPVHVSTGFCRHFLIYNPSVPAVHHITTAACEQTNCVR